jgi:hypothetical protein
MIQSCGERADLVGMDSALRRLGLVTIAAMSLAGLVGSPVQAAASVSSGHTTTSTAARAHRDPARSVAPSQRFFNACFHVSGKAAAQRACDAAARHDFDKVRANDGLPPMTLPSGFAKLSAVHQLLVLTNLERVDRGLHPFPGLSRRLDRLARSGAKRQTDPSFPSPFPGTFGGGNWAGVGTSTLLADYVWMYDDGPNSPNGDCPSPTAAGCWGHRHNILHRYQKPLAMGAGVAHHGSSMAAEYIGGDTADHARSPRWSHFRHRLPVGLSATHLMVHAAAGGSGHRKLRIWASGTAMHVTITLSPRDAIWSVSRSSCRLKPGHSCVVTVRERPTNGSVQHASLRVTGPNGSRSVTLAGRPTG